MQNYGTSIIKDWVENSLINSQIAGDLSEVLSTAIMLCVILLISYLGFFIAKRIVVVRIGKLAEKSKTHWDDVIFKHKVFHKLAYVVPAIIIYQTIDDALLSTTILEQEKSIWISIVKIIKDLTLVWVIVAVNLSISAFFNATHEIYLSQPISKDKPIKGYLQLITIVFWIAGFLLIISVLFDVKMGSIFTGLGAIAAVLILVFRDTLLGLIASIQLSFNEMVKPGDWIEVPKYGADGTVLEISLYSVKVQNWDKTISNIPTYALVSDSFQNWKGMEDSGGRRIKRHINIDMKSVGFLSADQFEKLSKFQLLKDYLSSKKAELEMYNADLNDGDDTVLNARRLTNIGTFRIYLEKYLKVHPKIHNGMTFLVRQLQPTDKGIPIEIYVFSNDQVWANYEAIQSDIFDHVLAIIPEFGLNVYQNPTGEDFKSLTK